MKGGEGGELNEIGWWSVEQNEDRVGRYRAFTSWLIGAFDFLSGDFVAGNFYRELF